MSLNDERSHRHFFSTKVSHAQKDKDIFPTASPRALIEIRSGLYDYPAPRGGENDLIYQYRYDQDSSGRTQSGASKQQNQQQNNQQTIGYKRNNSGGSLAAAQGASGASKNPVLQQHHRQQQLQQFKQQKHQQEENNSVSLCNGSPGRVRLAREYAVANNTSFNLTSSGSQRSISGLSSKQNNNNNNNNNSRYNKHGPSDFF